MRRFDSGRVRSCTTGPTRVLFAASLSMASFAVFAINATSASASTSATHALAATSLTSALRSHLGSPGTWNGAIRTAGLGRAEHGRQRRCRLDLVYLVGQLQRRRQLPRRFESPPGLRRERDGWSTGATPSRCRAPRHSTPAVARSSTRSRARRAATAAPVMRTRTPPATSGIRRERNRRYVGHRHRSHRCSRGRLRERSRRPVQYHVAPRAVAARCGFDVTTGGAPTDSCSPDPAARGVAPPRSP